MVLPQPNPTTICLNSLYPPFIPLPIIPSSSTTSVHPSINRPLHPDSKSLHPWPTVLQPSTNKTLNPFFLIHIPSVLHQSTFSSIHPPIRPSRPTSLRPFTNRTIYPYIPSSTQPFFLTHTPPPVKRHISLLIHQWTHLSQQPSLPSSLYPPPHAFNPLHINHLLPTSLHPYFFTISSSLPVSPDPFPFNLCILF